MGAFDPYATWLGIGPADQPPDHYRLLGVERFEKRPAAIEAAAVARMGEIERHGAGEHAAECQRLLAEISAARLCLTNENRRAAYDANLLQIVAAKAAREAGATGGRRFSASEFLDILAAKDLIPDATVQSLRKQLAASRSYRPAGELARILIDQGLLTQTLAARLLSTAASERARSEPAVGEPNRPAQGDMDEELGFAPDDEEVPAPLVLDKGQPRKGAAERQTAGAPRPIVKMPALPDAQLSKVIEDPSLGGALHGKTPKLFIPKKKGWFDWLRLPKLVQSEDAWIVWLAVAAVVTVALFLGILVWKMSR